jgi:hypothetical protein
VARKGRAAIALVGSVALSGSSGCFLAGLAVPDTATPADKARAIAPKCAPTPEDKVSEEKVASFASPSAIESVEAAYSFVPSTASNHEARLRGALFHLRPTNLSKEVLARGFECHEARVTLGSAPPFANDPYVLPGRWLSIDVDSYGDGLSVQVRATTFNDAQLVLARAKLFVANHP